ncbi:hypothetical protein LguiA_033438 [Lonicera macranthoides]
MPSELSFAYLVDIPDDDSIHAEEPNRENVEVHHDDGGVGGGSGGAIEDTLQELGQEEAARILTDDHHPSGSGQSSALYHLPILPTVIPYLDGGIPKEYTIPSCPIPKKYTLPGLQGETVCVSVGELRL